MKRRLIVIKGLFEKLKHMPLPIVPCMLGACTLSNVYQTIGFSLIKHIMIFLAFIILMLYILKIIIHPSVVKEEYKNPVTCSLYPMIFMVSMAIGAYILDYSYLIGKIIWSVALLLHFVHIIVFTYLHLIKNRDINTFLPTWFVTYNGIMVSSVSGSYMGENGILYIVIYYGIIIYFILLPIMIWRLIKFEIKDTMQHGTAILLGPCSLCVVSYINIIENKNLILLSILYICVILSLIFVLVRLPKFFSYAFTPAFAGLTFPMAIGTYATQKMVEYLSSIEYTNIASILKQLEGIQLYITTAIIGFVLFNFARMFRLYLKKEVFI